MNLFRSEEHVRRWAQFDSESQSAIKTVAEIAAVFALPLFRERLAPDYLLRMRELAREFETGLARRGKSWSRWQAQPPAI